MASTLFFAVHPAFAETEMSQVLESKAVMIQSSDLDENIRSDAEEDGASLGRSPRAKQEFGKANDLACSVSVENRTSWDVRIFVDGSMQMTVDPLSLQEGLMVESKTKLYAKTRMADALDAKWGPKTISCERTTYTWRLTP